MSFVGKWYGFGRNPHFDNGVRAYEQGAFDTALEQFKICAASEPDSGTRERAKSYQAGCLGKLARAALVSSQYEQAIAYLKEATTIRPRFADLQLLLAEAQLSDGDRDAAKVAVDTAFDINPRYANAHLFMIRYHLTGNDSKAALASLDSALQADERLKESPHESLADAIVSGMSDQALKTLSQVRIPVSRDANDLAARGDAHVREERWSDAEEAYRQALEIAPRYADIRCKHGQTLLELNELTAASNEFREAISINSNYSEAYALLGVALKRLGDEEGAKDAFKQALVLDPNHPIARFEAGSR